MKEYVINVHRKSLIKELEGFYRDMTNRRTKKVLMTNMYTMFYFHSSHFVRVDSALDETLSNDIFYTNSLEKKDQVFAIFILNIRTFFNFLKSIKSEFIIFEGEDEDWTIEYEKSNGEKVKCDFNDEFIIQKRIEKLKQKKTILSKRNRKIIERING